MTTEVGTFAAGCFWGVEYEFAKTPGVISAMSGYTGGSVKDPDYRAVCTGKTGHAEAVRVEFNPDEVSYEQLLDIFWTAHDPTQLNRQGPDVGTQYRSAIFFHDEEQERLAKESVVTLEQSGRLAGQIATEITPASEFYEAEEYHQRYYEKLGR
jgi:peptide-methionine (S)-S-oxide reductase